MYARAILQLRRSQGGHKQRRGKYLLFFERNEASISFEGFRPRKDGNFARSMFPQSVQKF